MEPSRKAFVLGKKELNNMSYSAYRKGADVPEDMKMKKEYEWDWRFGDSDPRSFILVVFLGLALITALVIASVIFVSWQADWTSIRGLFLSILFSVVSFLLCFKRVEKK